MTTPTDDPIDSLADPAALRDRADVEVREERREVSREQYEGLAARYADLDGVVQVGVRRADGAVLLQTDERGEGWCPPGGNVEHGQDWVDAARVCMETTTGEAVAVDEPVLYGRTTFLPGDDGDAAGVTAETVLFRASLAEPDTAFAAEPTLPDGLDHPIYGDGEEIGLRYGWFDEVPEDAHPNHEAEIRLLLG